MTIVQQPVQMVEERLFCDVPGCALEMTPTGTCLTSWPPKYPHQCPNGHRTDSSYSYPRIVSNVSAEFKRW